MEKMFTQVLLSVFSLVVLAVPGYLLGKFKVLPEKATKALTGVLLFVGQPMMTFMSFQKTTFSDDVVKNLLLVAGLAFLVHTVMLVLTFGLFFKKASNNTKLRIVNYASVFGNCGFMGLPFLQMLFGSTSPEAIMYGAVVVAVFNFLSWTVGIFFITHEIKFIKIKKAILNPPFIALLVSLPLFLILKKPISLIGEEGTFLRGLFEKLSVSANYLSDLVTPLSMIILGIRLSEMNFKAVFINAYTYLSSSMKLIVMPAIAFLLCTALGVSDVIRFAIFFEFCMPTATQTLLFSEQYGGDAHTASSAVLFSTMFSVLTIPLMYLAFSAMFGVYV